MSLSCRVCKQIPRWAPLLTITGGKAILWSSLVDTSMGASVMARRAWTPVPSKLMDTASLIAWFRPMIFFR